MGAVGGGVAIVWLGVGSGGRLAIPAVCIACEPSCKLACCVATGVRSVTEGSIGGARAVEGAEVVSTDVSVVWVVEVSAVRAAPPAPPRRRTALGATFFPDVSSVRVSILPHTGLSGRHSLLMKVLTNEEAAALGAASLSSTVGTAGGTDISSASSVAMLAK